MPPPSWRGIFYEKYFVNHLDNDSKNTIFVL
nr:MAG TPA: hypothetical protein [Caudoviricetes sp.]